MSIINPDLWHLLKGEQKIYTEIKNYNPRPVRITLISDTHNMHDDITSSLPGGDILIHAGDLSGRGTNYEIDQFLKWYNSIDNYYLKIFIAGNHDWGFQTHPEECQYLLEKYDGVCYLQDRLLKLGDDHPDALKIWGSPWQPEFYSWAFNLPRQGEDLREKWAEIPEGLDILVTHGPSWGNLDTIKGKSVPLGCELLRERIDIVKPKIHVCGHIHTGYGYKYANGTHYFNAAVLDERYEYKQKPFTFDWNRETNEIEFI
jgi:predicted phosphodiesterase